jgi:hypothetical protein
LVTATIAAVRSTVTLLAPVAASVSAVSVTASASSVLHDLNLFAGQRRR